MQVLLESWERIVFDISSKMAVSFNEAKGIPNNLVLSSRKMKEIGKKLTLGKIT